MQVSLTGRHLEINSSLKDFVEKNIGRLNKYASHIISIHVILEHDKFRYIAEIVLNLKKRVIKAKEVASDAYLSVERATKKLEKTLKRLEEKLKIHRKGGDEEKLTKIGSLSEGYRD